MLEANLKAYDRLTLVGPASILGGSDDDFKRASDIPISYRKMIMSPMNISIEQIQFSSHGSAFSDPQISETGRSSLGKAQEPYTARSYISDI